MTFKDKVLLGLLVVLLALIIFRPLILILVIIVLVCYIGTRTPTELSNMFNKIGGLFSGKKSDDEKE